MSKFIVAAFVFSALAAPAFAQEIAGKVTAVEGEGRTVVIGETKVAVSGSGTKVTIKNEAGKRDDIAVGMTCKADAAKATMIACN